MKIVKVGVPLAAVALVAVGVAKNDTARAKVGRAWAFLCGLPSKRWQR